MKICIECQQKKNKLVFYLVCISKMYIIMIVGRYSCVNLSACSRLSARLKDIVETLTGDAAL